MRKVFVISITAIMLISVIFYFLSHAPCKKNKSTKMAKIRKISTAVLALATGITLLYVGMPKTIMLMVPSLIIIHISFDIMIKNL